MKFRKKPVVIDAFQLTGAPGVTSAEFSEWCEKTGFDGHYLINDNDEMIIHTLEGDMTASPGDWIIKGVAGEFYPCKPEIFAESYDIADSEPNDGGPAFPVVGNEFSRLFEDYGMSMRDYFAGKAMIALLPMTYEASSPEMSIFDTVASDAYAMADAMLKAREAS